MSLSGVSVWVSVWVWGAGGWVGVGGMVCRWMWEAGGGGGGRGGGFGDELNLDHI